MILSNLIFLTICQLVFYPFYSYPPPSLPTYSFFLTTLLLGTTHPRIHGPVIVYPGRMSV